MASMKRINFTKMQGAGNDFIVFDLDTIVGLDLPDLARRVCDRHFGVGADGLLAALPSESADLQMLYLNSDGSAAEMCGNGLRCLARYAADRGEVSGDSFEIETATGIRQVSLKTDGFSRVGMGVPEVGEKVELRGHRFLRVSMGNPHAVTFLRDERAVKELELREIGPRVEGDSAFLEGTNVEFASLRTESGAVRMRIWERGAGETLASGTGSCATAVAAIHHGLAESPVTVLLDGGRVEVEWHGAGEQAHMTGPAEYVCSGEFFL